jgi:hypothetical protein
LLITSSIPQSLTRWNNFFLSILFFHTFWLKMEPKGFHTEVHHVNGDGEDAGVVYCEMQGRESSGPSRCRRRFIFLSLETIPLWLNMHKTLLQALPVDVSWRLWIQLRNWRHHGKSPPFDRRKRQKREKKKKKNTPFFPFLHLC